MTKDNLGIVCERCGSSRIVPLIYGSADDRLLVLDWQGKIGLGGSIVGGIGSHLWECSDCHEPVNDKRFLLEESDTFPMRVYDRMVERILAEYEPVDDLVYSALQGRSYLKTVIRHQFASDVKTLTLFPGNSGLDIDIHTAGDVKRTNYDYKGTTFFEAMLTFVSQQSPPHLSPPEARLAVRVGREERDFILSIDEPAGAASPVIVIRKVDDSVG